MSPEGVDDLIAELQKLPRVQVSNAAVEPPLKPPHGRDTLEGMDPWQQSVESRLKSLDDHVGRIEPDITSIKTSVAVLTERVSHLPSKDDLRDGLRQNLVGTGIVVSIIAAVAGVALHFIH